MLALRKNMMKEVNNCIPYQYIYDDGMIESADGCFSRAYTAGDINFETASDEEQLRIFHAYKDVLNGLPDNVSLQVVIQNKHEQSKLDLLKKVVFRPLRDGMNDFRQMMNSLMADRLAKGKNGLEQQKYFVLSVNKTDTLEAKATLEALDGVMRASFSRLSGDLEIQALTSEERLRSLFSIYNQDGENVFDNARRADGTAFFNFRHMFSQGRTTKDEIAPSGFDFKPNYFRIGNHYGKAFYMEKIPVSLSTDYLQELANINCPSLISIYYEPIPQDRVIKMVRNNITALDAEIEARKGDVSEAIRTAKEGSIDFLRDLVNRQQKAFYTTVAVVVFAENMTLLEDYSKQVVGIGVNRQAPVRTLLGRQLQGLNSCLPLGKDYLEEKKLMTTESASVFFPFTSLNLSDFNGINYGTNEVSKNQIFYNRLNNKNYNGLVFSKSGGGKSATVKLEALQTLLRDRKNYVHIIDPHGEYVDFARKLGGEVITLSANSDKFLNPFDMDVDFNSDDDPLAEKSDYIIGMLEIMQHGAPLDPQESSILDRCVRRIYKGYIEHMEARHAMRPDLTTDRDVDSVPTLRDLYYELKRQNDRDAETLAKTIEMYAMGSMQLFSNRTTVDSSSRLTVYDIHRLGSGTRNLGLYVCINALLSACHTNKENGCWTYMYIDEMQTVMGSDTSTKPLATIWETVRKFNGVPTGVLQNTNNILASVEGRNILNNSNTIVILDTGATDRANLVDYLHLSDTEAGYITNARVGHGLLCAGSLRIPFNNYIDKTSYKGIFDLINTTEDRTV